MTKVSMKKNVSLIIAADIYGQLQTFADKTGFCMLYLCQCI